MDVHPTKNGINRYWSIAIYLYLDGPIHQHQLFDVICIEKTWGMMPYMGWHNGDVLTYNVQLVKGHKCRGTSCFGGYTRFFINGFWDFIDQSISKMISVGFSWTDPMYILYITYIYIYVIYKNIIICICDIYIYISYIYIYIYTSCLVFQLCNRLLSDISPVVKTLNP